jgi:hypothetical protein
MGPKERDRRIAKQRVDRSHRGVVVRGVVVSRRRPPSWTPGEKAVLVLSLTLLFGSAILIVVPFVLPT